MPAGTSILGLVYSVGVKFARYTAAAYVLKKTPNRLLVLQRSARREQASG